MTTMVRLKFSWCLGPSYKRNLSLAINVGLVTAKYDLVHLLEDDVLPQVDSLRKMVTKLTSVRKHNPNYWCIGELQG